MSKNDRAQEYPRELASPNQFPSPTRLPAPGPAGEFRIVAENFVVADRRDKSPLSTVVV